MSESAKKLIVTTLLCSAVLATTLSAHANTLRDPMRPANYKNPQPGVSTALTKKRQVTPDRTLKLSAITYTLDAPSRSAIINDLWVRHGSVVNEATVLHIGNNTVELVRDGEKIIVHLLPQIKSPREG